MDDTVTVTYMESSGGGGDFCKSGNKNGLDIAYQLSFDNSLLSTYVSEF